MRSSMITANVTYITPKKHNVDSPLPGPKQTLIANTRPSAMGRGLDLATDEKGHSTQPTPSTAKAEKRSSRHALSNFCFWPKPLSEDSAKQTYNTNEVFSRDWYGGQARSATANSRHMIALLPSSGCRPSGLFASDNPGNTERQLLGCARGRLLAAK